MLISINITRAISCLNFTQKYDKNRQFLNSRCNIKYFDNLSSLSNPN